MALKKENQQRSQPLPALSFSSCFIFCLDLIHTKQFLHLSIPPLPDAVPHLMQVCNDEILTSGADSICGKAEPTRCRRNTIRCLHLSNRTSETGHLFRSYLSCNGGRLRTGCRGGKRAYWISPGRTNRYLRIANRFRNYPEFGIILTMGFFIRCKGRSG